MDEKGKRHNPPKLAEKNRKAEGWQLSEEDKTFLRSCNIRPE